LGAASVSLLSASTLYLKPNRRARAAIYAAWGRTATLPTRAGRALRKAAALADQGSRWVAAAALFETLSGYKTGRNGDAKPLRHRVKAPSAGDYVLAGDLFAARTAIRTAKPCAGITVSEERSAS
jgi:hypothetical protein